MRYNTCEVGYGRGHFAKFPTFQSLSHWIIITTRTHENNKNQFSLFCQKFTK
ncbi:hypothetical protein LMANV2_30020 [Leptospira interrogans serovar Manilae]|uniref:Uncharacterized protein n=1 Tax=Leptospira interrogans serovar Manilae TaxID=214675 RepID=A0AAQ1SNS2_LEPIR|nr:hypothetical protein LMANV2_30020 [Leptospira interrogans serovar Manilae]